MATARSPGDPSSAMRASVRAKSAPHRTTSFSFGVRGEEPATLKAMASSRFVFPWALSPATTSRLDLTIHADLSGLDQDFRLAARPDEAGRLQRPAQRRARLDPQGSAA